MSTTKTPILETGESLGGFRVDALIGVGGMAMVYRAEQLSLGRHVALKVLAGSLAGDESFRERFRREGQHAASLEHPYIIPVYDSGEADGLLFIAMRLVNGPTVAEIIGPNGLTIAQTLDIMAPIAEALDAAHAAGLVHRDVKPQNMLLTDTGHPYLADFGIARRSDAHGLTKTGGFVGSAAYASPEQIRGDPLSGASDVYALTGVLYQCLTGRAPYARDTEAGVLHAHLHEPPPTLEISGSFARTEELNAVIARGLHKDPTARYPLAKELLDDAAAVLDHVPASTRLGLADGVTLGMDVSTEMRHGVNGSARGPFTRPAVVRSSSHETGREASSRRWLVLAAAFGALALLAVLAVLLLSHSGRSHVITAKKHAPEGLTTTGKGGALGKLSVATVAVPRAAAPKLSADRRPRPSKRKLATPTPATPGTTVQSGDAVAGRSVSSTQTRVQTTSRAEYANPVVSAPHEPPPK